jgi:hypothetical protein
MCGSKQRRAGLLKKVWNREGVVSGHFLYFQQKGHVQSGNSQLWGSTKLGLLSARFGCGCRAVHISSYWFVNVFDNGLFFDPTDRASYVHPKCCC